MSTGSIVFLFVFLNIIILICSELPILHHLRFRLFYYRLTHNTQRKVRDNKGMQGEYNIIHSLHNQMRSYHYRILANLYIPRSDGKGTTEIDVLYIDSSGIYIIESKNYKGEIIGKVTDEQWQQRIANRMYYFYNPLKQNDGHVKALKKLLHYLNNDLFHPIVVFSDECKLNITSRNVIQQKDLLYKIHQNKHHRLTFQQIETVYRYMSEYANVSKQKKNAHIKSVQFIQKKTG